MSPQLFQQYTKHLEVAHEHIETGSYKKAMKSLRKAIEIAPDDPSAYTQMGLCYRRSNDRQKATEWYLFSVNKATPGTQDWAWAVSSAFNELMQDAQVDTPKPEWWNDSTLLAMSERVVEVDPEDSNAWKMRGEVLVGGMGRWLPGSRRAKDIRLAAHCFQRASALSVSVKEALGSLSAACLSIATGKADDTLIENIVESIEIARMTAGLSQTGTGMGPILSMPGHRPAPGEMAGAYQLQVQCLEVGELQRKIESGELSL